MLKEKVAKMMKLAAAGTWRGSGSTGGNGTGGYASGIGTE